MSIHIEGRRWFQRSYGNTYHSVRIYTNGRCAYVSDKQYGYGDQFLQTAFDWLTKNGHPECVSNAGTRFLREEIGGSYSVIDVAREKDL